ncbi:RNA polymerase sigma factor [Symbiobacterium terraclitae]|uniref:RNA polymerase sigma factor n=1 Tax=Symbiobacterium terraclitae TaxID=557451 RepID=UPI0035B5311E
MEEREAVRRCRAGDREAFAHLVREHQAAVLALCLRMTGSGEDAADAAQQAFLQAYRRLETYDPAQPFRPWLMKIAANECIALLRRRGRQPESGDESALERAAAPGPDAPALVELAEDREAVRRAVTALPPPYRTAVIQYYFEGLSYQQMAERSGLPTGTIATHLHRAKQMLRRILSEREVTVHHAP